MCGIAGLFASRPPGALTAIGEAMAAQLTHRGPDAQGVRLLPDERGVFAHTRLSIIDLSPRAGQPFLSRCGQVVLTFNGEIYNFKALRKQLADEGVPFRSDSDTEVILELYLARGTAGFDHLDGMFAFALYDARDRRFVLMRDRMGKKPLYWSRHEEALVFASEVKALAAADWRLEPDFTRLPEYLTYGYVETPGSFYKNVHRLPPASRLVWEADAEPKIETYWTLPRPGPPRVSTVQQALPLVRQTIGDAVERRLVSDVPLGAFLSGGVDSSIIVAEMAQRATKPVRTFAVGFDDQKTFDERSYARQIAQQFGTDHTELVVSASPVDLMEKLLWHHDEPYGDSSALAVYAVSKATRNHVTVVLTGDGGDEVFAGYTRFRGGLVAGVIPPKLADLGHRLLGRLPEPRGYKNPVTLLRRFLEHGDQSPNAQLLAWNSFFAGPALAQLLKPETVSPRFDPWSVYKRQASLLEAAARAHADRLDQILRHNLATYLLDDLLVKTDRMTMATSLEARSPFLDTELVETAFALPSFLKMRRGQLKWLLKEAYRDVLPANILDRKKHGFGVPLSTWWNNAAASMVNDLLLSKNAQLHTLLERQQIETLVREHRSGKRDHGQRIFLLLQLELWLQNPSTRRKT